MNSLRVEYLAILGSDGEFCADVASLNHLLQSDRSLVVHATFIQFEGVQFSYDVQTGTTKDTRQRYFHLAFGCNDLANNERFERFLKIVRGLLFRLANKEPQVLWNDVGLYYAGDAYPKIHELENMLRKLITKFMLTTIGLGWTKEVIPREVADSIKSKPLARSSNYLQQVDFIQLSNFLFKAYTIGDTQQVLETIDRSCNSSELLIEDLRQLIPKSNWERYFSPLVDCESDYLRVRWERLYELRNDVAHNRALSKSDHDEITRLISEIRPKIEDAISKLGDIELTDVERETVAESVAIGRDALNGEYIEQWKRVNDRVQTLALLVAQGENRERVKRLKKSAPSLLKILRSEKAISAEMRSRLRESFRLRNVLVHHSDVVFPEGKLHDEIDVLKEALAYIEERTERARAGGDQEKLASPNDDVSDDQKDEDEIDEDGIDAM